MKYQVFSGGNTGAGKVDVEAVTAEAKPDTTLLHFYNAKGEAVATFRNWDYFVEVKPTAADAKTAGAQVTGVPSNPPPAQPSTGPFAVQPNPANIPPKG